MKRRTLALAVLMLLAVGSVATAAHPHFGRMAFVHHTSPSHTCHAVH